MGNSQKSAALSLAGATAPLRTAPRIEMTIPQVTLMHSYLVANYEDARKIRDRSLEHFNASGSAYSALSLFESHIADFEIETGIQTGLKLKTVERDGESEGA